jgi:hypothetical protein
VSVSNLPKPAHLLGAQIFSGEVPFKTIADRLLPRHVVDQQKRPKRPLLLETLDYIWGLIQRCWAADPASRPSIQVVERSLKPYTSMVSPQKSESTCSALTINVRLIQTSI